MKARALDTPAFLVLAAATGVFAMKGPVGFDFRQGAWLARTFLSLAWAGLNALLFYALRRPHTRALFPDSAGRSAQLTTTER